MIKELFYIVFVFVYFSCDLKSNDNAIDSYLPPKFVSCNGINAELLLKQKERPNWCVEIGSGRLNFYVLNQETGLFSLFNENIDHSLNPDILKCREALLKITGKELSLSPGGIKYNLNKVAPNTQEKQKLIENFVQLINDFLSVTGPGCFLATGEWRVAAVNMPNVALLTETEEALREMLATVWWKDYDQFDIIFTGATSYVVGEVDLSFADFNTNIIKTLVDNVLSRNLHNNINEKKDTVSSYTCMGRLIAYLYELVHEDNAHKYHNHSGSSSVLNVRKKALDILMNQLGVAPIEDFGDVYFSCEHAKIAVEVVRDIFKSKITEQYKELRFSDKDVAMQRKHRNLYVKLIALLILCHDQQKFQSAEHEARNKYKESLIQYLKDTYSIDAQSDLSANYEKIDSDFNDKIADIGKFSRKVSVLKEFPYDAQHIRFIQERVESNRNRNK